MNYTIYDTATGRIMRTGFVTNLDISYDYLISDGEGLLIDVQINTEEFYIVDGTITERPTTNQDATISSDGRSVQLDVPDGTQVLVDWIPVDIIDGVVALPESASLVIVTPPFPLKPFSINLAEEAQ